MTASERPNRLHNKLPEAVVVPQRPVSLVWVIPIVALLIGGWLAYKAYSERGPKIRIEFKSTAGLEAGKTKVKPWTSRRYRWPRTISSPPMPTARRPTRKNLPG